MGKPNAFLSKLEEKHKKEMHAVRWFTIQHCTDMMIIAANEAFGFGADRAKKLVDSFRDVMEEYAELTVADAKDDKQIWYTKEKVDSKLREILGDELIPWDKRYK